MPVNRIISQVNLRKSDSVILIYGQVNDTFVTGDLALYNIDGIEKILCRYLHENGFEQILFYAPERQLYTYDERSWQYCFPGGETNIQVQEKDGRPLGSKKYLKKRTATTITPSVQNVTTVRWNTREGFIPVLQAGSDVAVADIVREALYQSERKSAVVFSQFDNQGTSSWLQQRFVYDLSRLVRRTTNNRCIIITNAVDQQKLKEVVDAVPVMNKIIKMENAGKGLDSLIYIGYPQKDEIRNLINRERIMKNKPVNWLQFNRIVTALDQGRDELKRWEQDFQEIKQIDIPSLNEVLTDHISEEEQSAFKKLDALIGLTEVKNELRRHLLQISDRRQNTPSQKPLMHIVLKGNPGTGKTTLARIIAEIFREEGLLERGHLIEVDRERLVAGYIGQTALKTDSCCRDALGGVLFVDEAYSLAPREAQQAPGGGTQDFGKEAIDALMKRMTDWQERFCVILAGYPEDMDRLLAANPGFPGRIGCTIVIADYRPEDLTAIFTQRAERMNRILSPEFSDALLNIFTALYKKRGKKFDNARVVEQLFGRIDGLHLARCLSGRLDRLQEPYLMEDIPADMAVHVKAQPQEGNARERLNELVGLEKAKKQISKQIALIQAGREVDGFAGGSRLHLIFKGRPGTGKTSVARLVGEIYQHYEILSNNHFIEASRKDLVGGYQGQTATKVEEVCKRALGGILFIDEVYTLINGDGDAFGREAVDTLMQYMENERQNLCVIIAGYPDKMRDFLDSNPGLQRRFSAEIEFEDYNEEQLYAIYQQIIRKKGIAMEDGVEASMRRILKAMYDRRDENFGNAGEVENAVQQIQENLAIRCYEQMLPIKATPITLADIPQKLKELLPVSNSDASIEEAMKELEGLVGLTTVKKHIRELVAEYKHERIRIKHNPKLVADKRSYHMIFMGNPGTGKTTVARILGKIFRALDILKKGEVIEVSRPDFVAGYQGQTADKTKRLIRNAFDNILFIDEAYSLINQGLDGFGKEAIDILVKMMEDHRDRLVVIAAGYPLEMQQLQRVNTGLASRFSEISFADYNIKEMVAIFKAMVSKRGYQMAEGLDADLEEQLNVLKAKKATGFGNARDIEKFFNYVVLPQYRNRVMLLEPEERSYWTITRDDFPKLAGGSGGTDNSREFNPTQEKREQRNKEISLSHSGSGDIVNGNKYVTINPPPKELPTVLTDMPEIKGLSVFGRDELVTELFMKLIEPNGSGKILLYGLPGIGKTQTIIRFIQTHQEQYEHIIWLDVNISLQKTFIENKRLLENLGIAFTEKEDEATRFAYVLNRLQEIKKKGLLIIEGLTKALEKEFTKLSLPQFKIIGAAREKIGGGHAVLVKTLEPAAARTLFQANINEGADISRIDDLLKPVSYHPLAVELLAKIWMIDPSLSFDQLLQKVQGLHIRKGAVDLTYETGTGAEVEVIDIFSMLFRMVELTAVEKTYIGYFSVLPALPMSRTLLLELFQLKTDEQKDQFNDAMVSLLKKGFVVEETGRGLYSHHIIQQVCRDETTPTVDNCAPLFATLGTVLGDRIDAAIAGSGIYALVGEYLYILESFITHFPQQDLFFSRVYFNLSVLYRVNGQFEESARISQKEKETLEPQMEQYPTRYNMNKK